MSALKVLLSVYKEGKQVKEIEIGSSLLVGRGDSCALRLDDRAVSRNHVELKVIEGGQVSLQRKTPIAPVSVNGAEVDSATVKEGDVISIGPYLMRLSLEKQVSASGSVPTPVSEQTIEPVAGSMEPVSLNAAPTESTLEIVETSEGSFSASTVDGLESAQQSENSIESSSTENVSSDAPSSTSEPQSFSDFSEADDGKTGILTMGAITAKLHVIKGVTQISDIEIDKNVLTLGRGQECDLILEDKRSSRKHAQITRVGSIFLLKDLDSANGVFVNEEKISERELSGEDVIRIGDTEIQFIAQSKEYDDKQQQFLAVEQEEEAALGESSPSEFEPIVSNVEFTPAPDVQAEPTTEIPGIGTDKPKKKPTLLERFKKLPKRMQMILAALIVGALIVLGGEEDEKPQAKPTPKPSVTSDSNLAFESLSPEKQKYVEAQNQLAFDLYRKHEYDRSLIEIQKIFAMGLPDYKNSREIERFAELAKRQEEAIAEEKRKKDEEERTKAKIAELIFQIGELMSQKKYDESKGVFPTLLQLDPENRNIAKWQREIDAYNEQKEQTRQAEALQSEKNKAGLEMFTEAMKSFDKEEYLKAIPKFKKIPESGTNDKKMLAKAEKKIEECREAINNLIEPILNEADEKEKAEKLGDAYKLYEKATAISPKDKRGYAGMDRIRTQLHTKAKEVYIEGVIAESYSDFYAAKDKFTEIIKMAPEEDEYYQKAQSKMKRYQYLSKQDAPPPAGETPDTSQSAAAPQDPSLPNSPEGGPQEQRTPAQEGQQR